MKLKYKIKEDGDDIEISLDSGLVLKITPENIKDISVMLTKGDGRDARRLAIEAAKNEIHWRLTNKNMNLHEHLRRIRHILGDALYFENIELKNEKIKDALRAQINFFECDERGVY